MSLYSWPDTTGNSSHLQSSEEGVFNDDDFLLRASESRVSDQSHGVEGHVVSGWKATGSSVVLRTAGRPLAFGVVLGSWTHS